jgi:FkbM family methyltransferase
VQDALKSHLKRGMTLYDIGANIGLFTLIGAREVGSTGKVYAFEPDPMVCSHLRENVLRNGFMNVEIFQAAVCSRPGLRRFSPVDPQISPDMGLGKLCLSSNEVNAIEVECIALDTLSGNDVPDVIKCDVEGAEMEVLEGARRIIGARRPTVICEVHSPELRSAVEGFFREREYSVRSLATGHLICVPKTQGSDMAANSQAS